MFSPTKLLVAAAILFIAYLLGNLSTTKFGLPRKQESLLLDSVLNVTLLGTNDLHSAFNGIGLSSYPESITGGYSKLVELIDTIRSKREAAGDAVLTLDAGDWYSGSLFDNLAADSRTSSIPQMEFFAAARYDAIILGNHDFDRYESALYTMLDKSHTLGLKINVLVSNLIPVTEDSKFQRFIESDSTVKFLPYLIKETKQGRVGVLGYVTPDALFVSNDYRSELQFVGYSKSKGEQYSDLVELVRKQSEVLKTQHKCDIIIAVIHGGHKDKEDIGLLNLPHINVVLGGHSHERYFYSTPDSSLTSQCGNAGMWLTALSAVLTQEGKMQYRGVDPEYDQFVEKDTPQCIKVTHNFANNEAFEQKIVGWNEEINVLFGIDQGKVVHSGDLRGIYQTGLSHDDNSKLFSHMFVEQYNKWEKTVNADADPVYVIFWNKEFLEYDQVTQPSSDVILTHGDAYNMIFFTATKDIHTFYVRKEDLYYTIQLAFVIQKTISPLLTVCAGGIVYDVTDMYGLPIISDIRTVSGVPYEEWPALVKVLTNSISARYFWKVDKFSYGFLDNFPRGQDGKPITLEQSHAPNAPKELDLFMNYLKEINSSL